MESVSNPALTNAQQAVLNRQNQLVSDQATAQGAVSTAVAACSVDLINTPLTTCQSDITTLNSDENTVTADEARPKASQNLDDIIGQLPSSSAPSGNSSGSGFGSRAACPADQAPAAWRARDWEGGRSSRAQRG